MFRNILKTAAWLMLSSSLAIAQGLTARIVGTVHDPSGAAVPLAQLHLVNLATGVGVQSTTNRQGRFSFVYLLPGQYSLQVQARGFRTLSISPIHLRVGDVVKESVRLLLGTRIQTVRVLSTPVLETQNASMGFVIEHKQIMELPLYLRNFEQLAIMAPGAGFTESGRGGISGLTLSGSRPEANNFTLDGISDVNPNFASVSLSPPLDAIKQFNVITNGYGAQYGRYAGGQIDVITQSGTRNYHGSVFDYLHNDVLNARNFFAPAGPVPPYRRNDFGLDFGGPILFPGAYDGRKNHAFFYFSYEGVRQAKSVSNVSHVPTSLERMGNFSQTYYTSGQFKGQLDTIYNPETGTNGQGITVADRQPFPGNIIPSSMIPPAIAALAATMPNPNLPGTGLNYINTAAATLNSNEYDARVDKTLGSKVSMFGRYMYNDMPAITPEYIPGRVALSDDAAQNLAYNLDYTLNSHLIDNLRLGFIRDNVRNFNGSGLSAAKAFWPANILDIGLPQAQQNDPGLPQFILEGEGGLWYNAGAPGDGAGSDSYKDNVLQGINNLTWIAGSHTVLFGVDFRYTRFRTINNQASRGSFGFQGLGTAPANANGIEYSQPGGNSWADFLLGFPTFTTRKFTDAPLYSRYNAFALYGDDSWQVSHKLTLNLGLRWEYNQPIQILPVDTFYNFASNAAGQLKPEVVPNLANAWPLFGPSGGSIAYFGAGGSPVYEGEQLGAGLTVPQRNEFAPRLGLAWSLNSKTVIRSAFGVFRNEAPERSIALLGANAPFSIAEDVVTAYWDSPTATAIPGFGYQSSLPNHPFANGFGFAPGVSLINPHTAMFGIDPRIRNGYTMQYNLNIERQMGPGLVAQLAFVGSQSQKLSRQFVMNMGAKNFAPPIPNYGAFWEYLGNGFANYNALQARVEQRTRHGLYFEGTYTWSKCIDTASATSDVEDNTLALQQLYPGVTRARCAMDLEQAFHASGDYNLPFGKTVFPNAPSAVKHVISNWDLAGILTLQGGSPQYPGAQGVSVTGQKCTLPASQRTPTHFFNTNCIITPAPGQLDDIPRDFILGPGLYGLDFSLIRDIHFTERIDGLFRVDVFNALNHPNFIGVNASIGTGSYGSVMGARDGRDLQIGMRLNF